MNDPVLQNLLELYQDYWLQRKAELLERWDYYNGEQAKYLPHFAAETEQDWQRRTEDAIIENHCKSTVNIAAGYLYGASDKISRRCDDPAAQTTMSEIWDFNDFPDFTMDVGVMTGVCGFSVTHLRWVDPDTEEPYPPTATHRDLTHGIVQYILMDSVETLPIAKPDNPKALSDIFRVSYREAGSGLPIYDRLQGRQYDTITVIEHIDDAVWHRWDSMKGQFVQTRNDPNPFHSVSTLFVVFSNPGDPMYLEGDPDHLDVIPLNRDLNERLTDDRLTISYHSFPILVHDGDLANFILKPNSHIQGDPDKIKYLTWDNVLAASQEHAEQLRRNISLVSSVTDLPRGRSADIGQVRSGAGLRSMFQADMLLAGRKQKRAIRYEKRLIRSSLEMTTFYTGQPFSTKNATIIFPDDIFGLDELWKAQAEQLHLQSGTKSLKDYLKENYPNLTEHELDQKLEEIKEFNDWRGTGQSGNGRAVYTNEQASIDQQVP